MADEFSAEIADGVAYVSGYDHDSRPVLVIFSLFIRLCLFSQQESEMMKHIARTLFVFSYRFSESNKTTTSSTHRNSKFNIITTKFSDYFILFFKKNLFVNITCMYFW